MEADTPIDLNSRPSSSGRRGSQFGVSEDL